MDSSEEDTEYCNNCKRDIPAANFVMHQTHCVRNIVLCKKCQEPVPRSELDAHEEEYHVLEVCDCGESFEKESMEDHKTNSCRLRKVKCEYCELELNFEKMSEHKDFCGSRTEKCEKCKVFVKLRDQSAHERNGCRQSTLPQFEKYPHLPGFYYPGRLENASLWPEYNRAGVFNEGVHVSPERYVRQTVMEELDSNAMIGQRRSLKNETTQRHNKKNERTVQNAQMYSADVTDGSNLLKQQQEEEDYLLAFQLANIEADSAMARQTQIGSNVSPTNMSPVFHDPYRSSPPDVFDFSPSTSGITHSPQPDPINSNPFFRGSYRSPATNPVTSVQSVPDAGFETDFPLDNPHNPPSDVEIPCEFCRQLFPSSELFMHQEECQYGRNRTADVLNFNGAVEVDHAPRLTSREHSAVDVDDFFMPPRANALPSSLGVRYPPTTFTTTDSQTEVPDRMAPAIRNDSYRDKDYSSEEDETVMVPCEFCEELFPFDAVTFHQIHCAPENRYAQDDMRNYGFESPGVTDVAQPHIVQARHPVHRSVVEEFPEPPRRARKHQPDPIFDSFSAPKFETKVSVVSKEKTVNMLQRTHKEKLVNKGTAERMTSQPQKKVNAPFQQSKYSAFDRPEPTVAVVSVEKTQKMQRELRQGNIPNRTGHLTNFSTGLSQFNGLQKSAGTSDGTDCGVGSSSSRRQVNEEQTCDFLNGRTENVTRSPTDLSQINWQQIPEVMNGRKAKKEDFELSSSVIRSTRGKPSSSSSSRNQDPHLRSRMAFEDDDLIQDSTMNQNDSSFAKSRSTSEFSAPQGKREKTWEDLLEEMGKSPSIKSNPTSSPEARSRNLTEKNNMVTSLNRSSQRRENQGKRGRTAQRNCEKKLSSSSLSSRVTLPQSATAQKSLVVQGSSPSNLRKKENGERRGDTKLRDAPRNARPSDFEMDFDTDYVKQTITGVNQFMASSKNKGGAASKNNNSRKGQLTEDRGQREREQRGRRNRSPRIVANFTEGDRDTMRNNREARNRRRNSNCRSTNQYE